MKLKNKLIVFLLSFFVLPLLLVGYYFSNESYNMVLDNTIKTTSASLQQIRENLRERLLTYIQMSNLIMSHGELRTFLGNPPADWQEQLDWYRQIIVNEIGRYSVVNPYLKATVYVDNDTLLFDHTHIKFADDDIKSSDWYQTALMQNDILAWQGLEDSVLVRGVNPHQIFSFTRPLNINNRNIGVLRMEIGESHLYSLISEESQDKVLYIVNPSGEIISSNHREALGSNITQYIDMELFKRGTVGQYVQATFEDQNSLIFMEEINSLNTTLNWSVIAVIPDSQLLGEAMKQRNLGIIITAVLLLWLIGAVWLITWRFTSRIRAMVVKMNLIRHGYFGNTVEVKGKDELSYLGHTFNLMSLRLKELVEEVYESQIKSKDLEIKQRRSELKALQSQINPHFLFNTLDSIRTGALRNKDEETVEKIELLAELFRKTMSWQGDYVRLGKEMAFVSDYVRLQQLRFKDRIKFEVEIEPSIDQLSIPKFIIQPIVENAIIHGIEKSENACKLSIQVYTNEHLLHIVVADNGIGISDDRLREIQKSLAEPMLEDQQASIGLHNVHERIKHIYGEMHGLYLEHNIPVGVRVTIRLPLHQTIGGTYDV